jgi:regulator of RNase E activity RraA
MTALAPETLDLLRQVSTATLTSQLLKVAGLRTRSPLDIRPLNPAKSKFVGPAVTLRYGPLREDLEKSMANMAATENPTRRAIEESAPGSVIMIDTGGNITGGAVGDILAARMIYRGIAGLVTDGAMRDAGPLMAMDLPVHARVFTPPPHTASTLAIGYNETISCGGTLVFPGDIVVGDEDGVVVIPRHLADKVAVSGLEQEQVEAYIKRRVELGEPIAGFYPASERTMADYRAWVAAGRPELKVAVLF